MVMPASVPASGSSRTGAEDPTGWRLPEGRRTVRLPDLERRQVGAPHAPMSPAVGAVAFMRAQHHLRDEPNLLDDPYAHQLLTAAEMAAFAETSNSMPRR